MNWDTWLDNLVGPKLVLDLAKAKRKAAEGQMGLFDQPAKPAAKPKPKAPAASGWQAIPGGKKGGQRRKQGGKWVYRYPDGKGGYSSSPPKPKAKPKAKPESAHRVPTSGEFDGRTKPYPRHSTLEIGRGFDAQHISGPKAMPGDHWTHSLAADPNATMKILSQRFDRYGQWSYVVEYASGNTGVVPEHSLKSMKAKPRGDKSASAPKPKPSKVKLEPAKPAGPERRIAERWMAMNQREKMANLQELGQQKGMSLIYDGKNYIVSQGKDHKVAVGSIAEAKDLIQAGSVKGAKPVPGTTSWTKAPGGETLAVTDKAGFAIAKDNTVTKVEGKKKTTVGKFESEPEAVHAVKQAAAPKPKPKPKYKLAPVEHYDGYGPNAWRGAKSGKLGAKETTAAVRKEIKQAQAAGWLPEGVKVSVSHEGYAGGWSMNLKIKELPPGMMLYEAADYDEFEHRYETPSEGGKVPVMRPEIADMIKKMEQIADQYNYDDSDSMTDYFNRGFYVHSGVGHELDSLHRTMALDPAKGVVLGSAAQALKTRDLGDIQDALVGYHGSGMDKDERGPWGLGQDLRKVLADNLGELAGQHGGKLQSEKTQAQYRSKGFPPSRIRQIYGFETEAGAEKFYELVAGLTGADWENPAPRDMRVVRMGHQVDLVNIPLDVPSKRKGHKAKKKVKKSMEPRLVLHV